MNRARTGRMGAASSAPSPGVQGTLGGVKQAVGTRPGRRSLAFGDEIYLWILVGLEVLITAALRGRFSRYHGG